MKSLISVAGIMAAALTALLVMPARAQETLTATLTGAESVLVCATPATGTFQASVAANAAVVQYTLTYELRIDTLSPQDF